MTETIDYAARYCATRDRLNAVTAQIQPTMCEVVHNLETGHLDPDIHCWEAQELLEEAEILSAKGQSLLAGIETLRAERKRLLRLARRAVRHRRGWDHLKFRSDASELQKKVEEHLTTINEISEVIQDNLGRVRVDVAFEVRNEKRRRHEQAVFLWTVRRPQINAERRQRHEAFAQFVAVRKAEEERITRLQEHPFTTALRELKFDE